MKKKKKRITHLTRLQFYTILKHRQFLKHLLGVRDSTANVIVVAELGRFPLCFHWWQEILRYHNRINDLSDDELHQVCLC